MPLTQGFKPDLCLCGMCSSHFPIMCCCPTTKQKKSQNVDRYLKGRHQASSILCHLMTRPTWVGHFAVNDNSLFWIHENTPYKLHVSLCKAIQLCYSNLLVANSYVMPTVIWCMVLLNITISNHGFVIITRRLCYKRIIGHTEIKHSFHVGIFYAAIAKIGFCAISNTLGNYLTIHSFKT